MPEESNNQFKEVKNSTCPDLGDHSDTIFNGESPAVQFDNPSRLDCSLKFNDYCGTITGSEVTHIRNQEIQTYPDIVSVGTQTEEVSICTTSSDTAVKIKETITD